MADNREVLNEAEVEFLLAGDDDAPTTSTATAPAEAEAQTVTMRGDLEQINLADIFQTLSMSKMEGVLRLRNPLEERQIHCRDGVVQILVPNRIATRRLGQRLVQAGLVEVEQLRAALVNQRKEKKPLGEMLIGAGLVTREQIEGVIGMQVSEDLFNLFTWRHGTFEFFKGPLATDAQRAAFANCPEFEVNSLLLEVARRSDEWESILDSLGSLDEVPERIADPADESALDENHRTLMASVDARHTYRELAEQTTSGLFEVSRAARDLVNGGLLANVADEQLVAVATELAASDHGKRALVLLQTLRDRPGERTLEILQGMAGFLPGRRSERATTDRRLAWPRGMASTPLIFFVVFPISTRNHSETKCKIFRGIVARGFLARDSLLRGQCAYRAGVSRACRVPEVPRVAHARGLVVVPLRRAVPRAGHRSKPGPNRFEFGPQKVGR